MKSLCKYLTLLLLLALVACGDKTPKQQASVTKDEMKGSMEKANRYLLNEEEEDIKNYVSRHGLDMTLTGTGLRYQILNPGSDRLVKNGDEVTLEYELHSITGDLIYSSANDGVKNFVVGEGGVETGLNEAVTYLHYGDVAKVIIPFHLGYGLHGDDNKIPQYATLVYTIKIIDNQ